MAHWGLGLVRVFVGIMLLGGGDFFSELLVTMRVEWDLSDDFCRVASDNPFDRETALGRDS